MNTSKDFSFFRASFLRTRGSSSAQEFTDVVLLQETSEESWPVLLDLNIRGFKNSVDFGGGDLLDTSVVEKKTSVHTSELGRGCHCDKIKYYYEKKSKKTCFEPLLTSERDLEERTS
eukprot:TRINITY_DN1005_c0_g1_i1.p1 TRINITY_DN1005_c0_g1~~TRINITY_DN1005_c0_g1_i1.p1  ORF type:complete len:117 (+),score=9.34 TRINITY_DN1005_c0_g1_i1:177-527(+)